MEVDEFCLVGGRYLYHGDSLVCTAVNLAYARPLMQKLTLIQSAEGEQAALNILDKMLDLVDTSSYIRKPNDADRRAASSQLVGPMHPKYGSKHTCLKCGKKYYDLFNKIKECPEPTCRNPRS